MLTVEYAKNPIYGSEDGQVITLTVKFYEFNDELPFGATSYDPMPYGVDIYNRAVAGEFGPVAPYVPIEVAEDQPTVSGTQTI